MDPYQTRDRVIEILTKHVTKTDCLWRVDAPCGMESYVLIRLPGPQNLSLSIEYAKRGCDLGDRSDISGMRLIRNGRFISCPTLGFGEEGIHKKEMRNIPLLLARLDLISEATKNVVVLESRCEKSL